MQPDTQAARARTASLRAHARDATPSAELLARIDDALSEGYAHALAGDAWSTHTERRLHELITGTRTGDDTDPRTLAREHARFEGSLVALRAELAALRRERDRLLERAPLRSG